MPRSTLDRHLAWLIEAGLIEVNAVPRGYAETVIRIVSFDDLCGVAPGLETVPGVENPGLVPGLETVPQEGFSGLVPGLVTGLETVPGDPHLPATIRADLQDLQDVDHQDSSHASSPPSGGSPASETDDFHETLDRDPAMMAERQMLALLVENLPLSEEEAFSLLAKGKVGGISPLRVYREAFEERARAS